MSCRARWENICFLFFGKLKNEFEIIVGLFSGATDANDEDGVDHFGQLRTLSGVQLEDLPPEVLLQIFKFLNIREILKFGNVSSKLRAISNDESLWLKLNFSRASIPYELVEKAVENGCKYLCVEGAHLYGGENSKLPLDLKYLEMSRVSFGNGKVLLENCRSLEKLSLTANSINIINNIGKNGQTLKVLKLGLDLFSIIVNLNCQNVGNGIKAIEKLFKSCVELDELTVSAGIYWDSDFGMYLTAMVNNLTPNIRKVDLSCYKSGESYLQDEDVKLLVERCNRITELNLEGRTSITNVSVDSIATHLNSSLEKLNVSKTQIDCTALLQLRAVGTLKVLLCSLFQSKRFEEEGEELKNLRKNLPQVGINEKKFDTASTFSQNYYDFKNGFWEIKAKAQKFFQN